MGKSVSGRVVVVTGASAGVGRAVARKFAARGDRVALLARGERGLDGAARDVEDAGGVALPIALDVADYQAVQQAAQQVQQALGPIDVWVNNAMTSVFARFEDLSPEEFHRVNDVTYMGYVHGTKAALTCMRERDRGVIVQVGSALAYRGIPLQSAYCGAKHRFRGSPSRYAASCCTTGRTSTSRWCSYRR
jgi:NAD(P)-dependent dehydrogenase (short-subunit alcohol dehydrogenase family)